MEEIKKIKPAKRTIQMIQMRKEGRTYTEIGYKFGLCKQRVFELIRPEMIERYDINLEDI